MKFSWKINNPLKCFRIGWEYRTLQHPYIDMETWDETGTLTIWMLEVDLLCLSLAWGDMSTDITKPTPSHKLTSIEGGKK